MQNIRKSVLIIFIFVAVCARGQDPNTILNYVNSYKDLAIQEMQRTGVPASIKLAQGIHETMAGTSDLVIKSNNHFGIKCKDSWTGASVTHDDDLRGECFRKYKTSEDSYRDHSDFLKSSPRYAFLFNLDPMDYAAWAKGLKKAGYATNPGYSTILIRLIEEYHLQDYTLIAMGKMKSPTTTGIASAPVITESKETIPVAISVVKTEPAPTQIIDQPVKTEKPVITQPVYPEGEFKINETRVTYASTGTSYLAIAEKYNVPLARIFEFNDMTQAETVTKDQLIYLQRKRKTGNNEFHIVKPGEKLYDIAQTEAIRIESIREYNWLDGNSMPAVGVQLWLRAKSPVMPQLALKNDNLILPSPSANGPSNEQSIKTNAFQDFVSYTVMPKETIYSISKKYKCAINDIVKWNQLEGTDLKEGQVLKIYK